MNYYNEIDRYCAQWLRNLIAEGLIPDGEVDERDIREVRGTDLRGFDQCHFFAGLGGWPYALRLAGWPDDRPVWTGSCPCQPLSSAGQRKGHADERHLWPAFQYLISECRPATIFGEQVASKDGREWLAGIRSDLEAMGYACGGADLCAASVGAPQARQRLYWVALARSESVPRSIEQWYCLCSEQGQAPAEHSYDSLSAWLYDCTNPNSIISIDGFRRPVGQVRALGNAIVPQVAAEFVKAAMT